MRPMQRPYAADGPSSSSRNPMTNMGNMATVRPETMHRPNVGMFERSTITPHCSAPGWNENPHCTAEDTSTSNSANGFLLEKAAASERQRKDGLARARKKAQQGEFYLFQAKGVRDI
ncbi:hypothetical protein PHYBOEH_001674 [Phytophthora boehmeriae]|uniref:Uncharacterized protein n=1 Tax=Phytophthora boehmeriae TaxID=109152 RepID=A0A8T1WVQ1_9STRA|nr:hypothetical protein PHYBOEH_001674 [Phytophthora boehmeriae]